MLSAIKSIFKPKDRREPFSVVPNQRFDWLGGVRLYATEPSELVFPGELIERGEIIGTVIDPSPGNVQVAFTQNKEKTAFTEIRIRLESGQSVKLSRSSEAFLSAADSRPRVFMTALDEAEK